MLWKILSLPPFIDLQRRLLWKDSSVNCSSIVSKTIHAIELDLPEDPFVSVFDPQDRIHLTGKLSIVPFDFVYLVELFYFLNPLRAELFLKQFNSS